MIQNVNLTRLVYASAFQRFGYYGIRSNLLLYLTKELLMSDSYAGQVYGLFYGSLSLTSLAGGLLADTLLGDRFAGVLGLAFISASHVCLVGGNPSWVMAALILYSIGYGLFDPNLNAMVGKQYPEDKDEESRDAAYTILYTGNNIGAMLGPIVCGYIALRSSWGYGFLTGGLFSLVGLPFLWSVKQGGHGEVRSYGVTGDASVLQKAAIPAKVLFGRFAMFGLLAVTFWAVFDQLGSSVTLVAERYVDRQFGPFQIPAGFVQAVNPFMVVTIGIFLSFRAVRKVGSGTASRRMNFLFFGLLLLGVGFGLLALGSIGIVPSDTRVKMSWLWIVFAILMATLGELLFAPQLSSLLAGLSPAKRRSLIMGAWSATAGLGSYLSGTMSGLMGGFASLSIFFAISTLACWLIAAVFAITVRAMQRSHSLPQK